MALRVNGVRVTKAKLRVGEKGLELVITDPLLGEVSIDERFTLELLELMFPPALRERLPTGGWRKVSLRIVIMLLRSGSVVVTESETSE
jgi:hypothetical protein